MSVSKKNKPQIGEMIAAVVSGASYNFAIESMAKRMDFVAENYMTVKSLSAGLIGSCVAYFGKSPTAKASGYGLLGVAGASGASLVATMVVESGNPMQGRTKLDTLKKINTALNAKKKFIPPGAGAASVGMNKTNPYAALAFSDTIYPLN